MGLIERRYEEPLVERCARCGFVETDETVCACLHETGKREVHEYVRADLHRGAVEENERLRAGIRGLQRRFEARERLHTSDFTRIIVGGQ